MRVAIDEQFRNWNANHLKTNSMPKGHVLPVLQALQGHPESPRPWADHVHKKLLSLNFKSFPHEPCLHAGEFHGKNSMLLRQVEDFSIATPNKELEDSFLDIVDGHLKQKLKSQETLSAFNGLDVRQTSCHAKT